jgi:hypothetical protein
MMGEYWTCEEEQAYFDELLLVFMYVKKIKKIIIG